jgi:hypothetical protein
MVAGRSGETFVAGEQWRIERFGQGDINGVIGGEIIPQIPDSGQKEIVWISVHRKVSEVGKSHAAALDIYLAVRSISTHHLRDLDVE